MFRRSTTVRFLSILIAALAVACSKSGGDRAGSSPDCAAHGPDPHSFARPDCAVVEHLDLDVEVDFEKRRIVGTAKLQIDNKAATDQLWLDTSGLDIRSVRVGAERTEASFALGAEDEYLGRPLIIPIEAGTREVVVEYASAPEAAALQWLEPEQTTGGRHPFLLTQSQTIFARTWVPTQDSPGIRMTYAATVRVPEGLMAVMSAESPTQKNPEGIYRFRMPDPIPAYLLALAVGDLEFRPIGRRSGVYAEPGVVEKAAWEFADTETMIEVAERLYGRYRWGRYDLIVLPPSFPFGGMENPRMTFVTPTILAGDRSLVALIAHELAHSWSGNLVTNATWGDFWLNEGFTVYFERRIMEELYGRDYTEMLSALAMFELEETFLEKGKESPDTHLRMDLRGRDPEDSFTDVAYDKGYLFLRMIEEAVGRERWDSFLTGYFDEFAFQSMTTQRFLEYLERELIDKHDPSAGLSAKLRLGDWIDGPGLPDNAPRIHSDALGRVERELERWKNGVPASQLDVTDWTTHHRVHFLRHLPEGTDAGRMADLDAAFGFTETGNSEVLFEWLLQSIRRDYTPARGALEGFLTGMGRLKFLRPLYHALIETEAGKERARAIYAEARPGYHAISRKRIDEVLAWNR